MKQTNCVLAAMLCVGLLLTLAEVGVAEDFGPELIVNGDFEATGDPYPGWTLDTTTQSPLVDDPDHGKVMQYQRIGVWNSAADPPTEQLPAWGYWDKTQDPPVWTAGDRYGAFQTVKVTPGTRYQLKCVRKTIAAGPSGRAGLMISGATVVTSLPLVVQSGNNIYWDHGKLGTPGTGTTRWEEQTMVLESTEDSIVITGYGVDGCTAQIDNVSLKKSLKPSDE